MTAMIAKIIKSVLGLILSGHFIFSIGILDDLNAHARFR